MPRPRTFTTLLALFLIQSVVPAGTAFGGDSEEVEHLIRQGVDLRQQGRDARALGFFQQAFALARTPRTASQLGLCEMAVGYWIDAERHLAEGLSSSEHPWVSKNRRDLETALDSVRRNIGELSVEGGPPGADVSLNGKKVGKMPLPTPLRVNKGVVEVELHAPDHSPASRSLTIDGGQRQQVSIVLTRLPTPPLAPSLPAEKSVPFPGDSPSDVPNNGSFKRPVAWALAGVAGAAVVFGAIETSVWLERRRAFDQHTGPLPGDPSITGRNCGNDEKGYGGPGCLAIHEDISRARTLSIIGYTAAGALALTSIVLFVTSRPQEPKRQATLSCGPNMLGFGIMCQTPLR